MTLRQLRYICEIAKHSLNISAAAETLHTNQSGLSKQVKLLEEELGVVIFSRSKSRLIDITPQGQVILARARVIVSEALSIKAACQEFSISKKEPLVVAVTHTQARYFVPKVIEAFRTQYPTTPISMLDAAPAQVIDLVMSGEASVGLAVFNPLPRRDLVVLPCRGFDKVVVVPLDHPLLKLQRIELSDLVQYPLVMQQPTSTTGRQIMGTFEQNGYAPNIVLHATDSDVIKNYVTLRVGIAILSSNSFEEKIDTKLKAIPAGHLFGPSITNLFLSRHRYLQRSVFDFIELCAPEWTRNRVQLRLSSDAEE